VIRGLFQCFEVRSKPRRMRDSRAVSMIRSALETS
jgi:hypothetical protein